MQPPDTPPAALELIDSADTCVMDDAGIPFTGFEDMSTMTTHDPYANEGPMQVPKQRLRKGAIKNALETAADATFSKTNFVIFVPPSVAPRNTAGNAPSPAHSCCDRLKKRSASAGTRMSGFDF